MSISAIQCSECGLWFHAYNGVTATVIWAEHFHADHTDGERENEADHWPTLTSAPDSWGVQYEKETP